MTDIDLNAVLDKVAKLKALQDQPGTVEEAAAAASAIQRLMTRYNLSEAQIHNATRDDSEGFDQSHYTITGRDQWRLGLLNEIAKANFARTIYVKGVGRTYGVTVFGRQHNIDASISLYEYLYPTFERLATEGWTRAKRDNPRLENTTNSRGWKNGFYWGAVQAIKQRLADMNRQEAELSSDTGLVVILDDAVDKAFAQAFPHTRSSRPTHGQHGVAEGYQAGKEVNLAKQLE